MGSARTTRVVRALVALAAVVALAGIGANGASADTVTNAKHFFWAQGQGSLSTTASLTNDLIYHGGNVGTAGPIGVETTPAVYLVYWGTEWANGFTTADTDGKLYSSKTLQNYLNTFMGNLGGSPWASVQTQYCRNVPAGTTSCAGIPGAQFITNPKKQLKGVWTDPTPVPDDIIASGLAENLVDDPIAMEAERAAAHFNYDPNATYVILTPPRPIATGQPVYCGYHTQTTSIDGFGNPFRLQYAFIPWQNTDWIAVGCGEHNVNATSDAFGNGIFDSWSIVVGHEYSEAVTDPDNFLGVQDGWNDDQTSENGDKCAWYHTQNITLAGHQFAVQPTWSNEAFDAGNDGCQVSR
jgi:serine protease